MKAKQQRQLRVVFDTNVLYTDSANYLVREEVGKLIHESKFADLEIRWYLPDVVRHERQFQMQKRALELLPTIAKLEKLLGHNLNITQKLLIDSVETVVSQRLGELDLLSLPLDYPNVDWHQVFLDSVYRRAPFKDGETEKGFRDRIVVECFLQLVASSPKTAAVCRVVLVSNDGLVTQAVKARTAELENTAVLSSLEELKGLINTLVSRADEAFLALLKPKAEKLFCIPDDESTLFYKERVREKLNEKFAKELAAPPPGAANRKNGTWHVSSPNFVQKTGHRIQWISRITIDAKASKAPNTAGLNLANSLFANPLKDFTLTNPQSQPPVNYINALSYGFEGLNAQVPMYYNLADPDYTKISYAAQTPVVTHKGRDIYEVLWGADVTTRKELRRPSVDEVKHVESVWEQVT